MPVASLSSVKSWVPKSDEKLQEMTIKSLIHQVTEEQRSLSAQVCSSQLVYESPALISVPICSYSVGGALVLEKDARKHCYSHISNVHHSYVFIVL